MYINEHIFKFLILFVLLMSLVAVQNIIFQAKTRHLTAKY